ncbi:MAG TPA: protoporphyrinogen oxidase [Vicinamibacterales bacterium]|nr:protoporphyrinogen oxidase [Vicinamibacterales bacterium]
MCNVAIVGGGISGLAAAWELTARRIPFVLYERAPRLGGVIVTDTVDGYTIDAGPDALLTQKPAALALCRELGLAERLQPQSSRRTFVVRRQKLREMPEASVFGIPSRWTPFATTTAFSWHGKLRMAAEVLMPSRANGHDESIASFIGRRFGREAVAYMAEPLLAGIHGGDPEQLSMRAAFPRFMELEAKYRSVIAGLRFARVTAQGSTSAGGRASAAPSPFVALPDGMRELTAALAAALPADALHVGVGVDAIDRRGGEYRLRLTDGTTSTVSRVIVATPPRVATRLLATLDERLGDRSARLSATSSAVTIALGYRRGAIAHPLDGTGFVVPRREQFSIRAASWVSSKWSGRAPADRVLLRAYVGGASDPSAIEKSDDALILATIRDLARLMRITGEPEMARVYRWRDATPQLHVGHLEKMAALDRELDGFPGLAVTASGFRGTGIADCVSDARLQARNVAAFSSTS